MPTSHNKREAGSQKAPALVNVTTPQNREISSFHHSTVTQE